MGTWTKEPVRIRQFPGRRVSIGFGRRTRARGTWHSSECVIAFRDNQLPKRPSDCKVGHEEPPPSYSPQTKSDASGSVPASPSHSVTFKSKPTNFLALSNEQHAIQGEFVIDPCIHIPSSMLPLLGENETEDDRKNLCLASRYSSVNAEIWLLGSSSGGTKPRRTAIALTSDHGSIRAQLVRP
jgi:hypothetical protein